MHLASVGIGLAPEKERKILERITTHQLIILENPPSTPIEEIKIKTQDKNSPTKSDDPSNNMNFTQHVQILYSNNSNYPP